MENQNRITMSKFSYKTDLTALQLLSATYSWQMQQHTPTLRTVVLVSDHTHPPESVDCKFETRSSSRWTATCPNLGVRSDSGSTAPCSTTLTSRRATFYFPLFHRQQEKRRPLPSPPLALPCQYYNFILLIILIISLASLCVLSARHKIFFYGFWRTYMMQSSDGISKSENL